MYLKQAQGYKKKEEYKQAAVLYKKVSLKKKAKEMLNKSIKKIKSKSDRI